MVLLDVPFLSQRQWIYLRIHLAELQNQYWLNFFSTFASALVISAIWVDKPVFLYAACSFQSCSCCKVHHRTDPNVSGKGLCSEGGGLPGETRFMLRGKGACAGQLFQQGVANRGHCCSQIRWHYITLPQEWNTKMTLKPCAVRNTY